MRYHKFIILNAYSIMTSILREAVMGYMGWTCLHWLASNSYAKFCTPCTGWGFLQTFYLTQSSYCNVARWFHTTTAEIMTHTTSVMATWAIGRIASLYGHRSTEPVVRDS